MGQTDPMEENTVSTPPGPNEGTPAERPEPDAPTVEGPAETTPAGAGAAVPAAPAADAASPESGVEATAAPTRRQRFGRWARTPLGVGVLVAALMLVLVTLPVGLFAAAAGHEGRDHGGYGRDIRDGHGRWGGGQGDREGGWGPGRHGRDRRQPQNPQSPQSPPPSPSATTG